MSASTSPVKHENNPVLQNGNITPQKPATNKSNVNSVSSKPAKKPSKSNTKAAFLQKSPEDMFDEITELKKSMALLSEENATLKVKIRRVEEENQKKNEELKRASADKKSTPNTVVNNLKQKITKLEQALKEKENALKKFQIDNKSSKLSEMKIQMDTYYKEILRLKNLSNLKESAKTIDNEDVQKILVANKELEEENLALRKDLERALAVNVSAVKQEEYNTMSRIQLIGIISELDNKINTMKDNLEKKNITQDLKDEHSLEELTMKVDHFKTKYSELEQTVHRLREDRLHYHDLAITREQELKALRTLLDQVQKQVQQKPTSAPRKPPQSNNRTEKVVPSSGSETEVSPRKPQPGRSNVFDRLTRDTKSQSARTPRRENAANETDGHQKSKTFVQSSKARNAAKSGMGRPKPGEREKPKSPLSPSSRGTEKIPGTLPSSKSDASTAKAKTPAAASNEVAHAKHKPNSAPASQRPRKVNSTTNVQPNKSPETLSPSKATSFSSKPELTKEIISITEENFNSVTPENATTPVNKTVTYTVLKTVSNTAPAAPALAVPKVDRRTSLSDTNVKSFRQNVAAKKIQKMWKHHQHEGAVEQQRQKVNTFRVNKAARTIQRGWKKHSTKKRTPLAVNQIPAAPTSTSPDIQENVSSPSSPSIDVLHPINESSPSTEILHPINEELIAINHS